MFRIESFAVTDVGIKRDHNEDYFGIDEPRELFVVADGMGGHASGEVASRLAVENLIEFFTKTCRSDGFQWPYESGEGATIFEGVALSNAIQFANDRVFIESMKDRRYDDMGTTLVALAGAGDRVAVAHVGDSRVYRYRGGVLEQVTEDHSLLNHYIRTRGMTEEEIKSFKSKNVIVRAVGLKDYVEPDVRVLEKRSGDIYLLCSDGLSDLVEDWIIQEVISGNEGNLEVIGNTLVRLANQAGGKDNITVMLVRVHGPDEHEARGTVRRSDNFEELDSTDFLFEEEPDDRTQPHPLSLVETGPIRVGTKKPAAPAPRPEPAASPTRIGIGGRVGVQVSSGEVEVPRRTSRSTLRERVLEIPETRLRDTQPVPQAEDGLDLDGTDIRPARRPEPEPEPKHEPELQPERKPEPKHEAKPEPKHEAKPEPKHEQPEPRPEPAASAAPEPSRDTVAAAAAETLRIDAATIESLIGRAPAPSAPPTPVGDLPDEELAELLAGAQVAPLPERRR